MTRYRLPDILGGGECDLLTPLELATETNYADVVVEGLAIEVPFRCLTEVKPPLPPEPPEGTRFLSDTGAVWSRHDGWASANSPHHWFCDGGGGIYRWEEVVEKTTTRTPLVPDPLAEAPELPWARVGSIQRLAVNESAVTAAAAARVELGLEFAVLDAPLARAMGLALLRAAAQQEARDAR